MQAFSFFSGCLGLDLGLEKAGIETSITCDFDAHCRNTIRMNKPEIPVLDDVLNYSARDVLLEAGAIDGKGPDIIVGGPPCQAFSTAGKRASFDDPRGNVFLHFLDLCLELSPKAIVLENVRGLLSASLSHRPHNERGGAFPPLTSDEMPGSALNKVVSVLEKNGYSVSFNLYNAANFGVPQKRERVIIVAMRNGQVAPFLTPTHSEQGLHGLPKWTTFRETMIGLNVEHEHVNFSEKRLKFYKMLKAGQYWKHLPSEEIKQEAMGKSYFSGGGKTGFYRRLGWDTPSPTLVTHPAMPATDLSHPELDRPLSIQEYIRLQQFPDDWKLSGKLLDRYRQVGNAVPVGLGHAVGRLLLEVLEEKKNAFVDYPDFKYSRYKNTDHINWKKNLRLNVSQGEMALN